MTRLALPTNVMCLDIVGKLASYFGRLLKPTSIMGAQLFWTPSYPWVGWVGFRITQGQVTLFPRVLEPKCHNDYDICGQVAGCGLVNVVY